MPEIPLLGASAAKARQVQAQPQQAQPEPPGEENAIIEVECAYLVYRLPDGQVMANTNINTPIAPAREPHPHDIIGMSHAVIGDTDVLVHAGFLAEQVIQRQRIEMQRVMEAQQNAQIQAQMARRKA
jgi:hypothetical protein